MKKSEPMRCGTKCGPKCLFLVLLAALLAAGGLSMLVMGVMQQMSRIMPLKSFLLWYAGGFVLFGLAKLSKMKACAGCSMR